MRGEGADGRESAAREVNAARFATLGMLVAGFAHEVNTPLGALASNHDTVKRALEKLQGILADEVVDATELDEVRRIVRALNGVMRTNDLAVERVLELVGSLRTFGRPDRAEVDRVDVHEGLNTAITLLRHQWKDRIEIRRDYAELPRIECYPQQLNQLFMNLLLNAIQAIHGAGTVTARTRAEEGGVRVEVEDTGSGIPPENLPRIFEPGFTTKGARVGMGLGLLMARQIVDRHGGSIHVRSTTGQGSTFSVRLPLALAALRQDGAAGA